MFWRVDNLIHGFYLPIAFGDCTIGRGKPAWVWSDRGHGKMVFYFWKNVHFSLMRFSQLGIVVIYSIFPGFFLFLVVGEDSSVWIIHLNLKRCGFQGMWWILQSVWKSHHKPVPLISLTINKKTILLNWKDRTKISTTHWLNLLTDHSNQEKLTASLKNNIKSFENIWSPFLQYLRLWTIFILLLSHSQQMLIYKMNMLMLAFEHLFLGGEGMRPGWSNWVGWAPCLDFRRQVRVSGRRRGGA